jgi:hypothetical protein
MPTTDMYAGIYVKNVPKTANLFRKFLGAQARSLQPNMIELRVGSGRLLLNEREPQAHKTVAADQELELGIWVDNIQSVYDKLADLTQDDRTSDIRYLSQLEQRNSGIKDFRFRLAEGYYVRVTGDAA